MNYKIIDISERDGYYARKDEFIGKIINGDMLGTRKNGYVSFNGKIDGKEHVFYEIKLTPYIYPNSLSTIFAKQKELQEKIGVDPTTLSGDQRTEFIRMMFIGLVTEAAEVIESTPWKPWKKSAKYDEEAVKEELVDVMHFFINLCLVANLSPEELVERYINKNNINIKRQENGY